MAELSVEYTRDAPELMAFFEKPARALFDAAPEVAAWDKNLTSALATYQETIGSGGTFKGNEAVIITGQQPAIFTGPLYTIYKAVTAILLARKLEERFDKPCVPVFWVGSEDHDFEEARTAHFLTKNHGPLSLRYTPSADVEGLPMYRVPLEESLRGFIDQATEESIGGAFRDETKNFLHETLAASNSLAEWTTRVLAGLFRDTPLVFFSPDLPAARAAGAAIIAREIAEPLRSTALLNEAGNRLSRIGFPPQVTKGETECNFFLEVGVQRRKVLFEKKQFVIPEEELTYTGDEMQALLKESPERFSPNVALRCIVQQHLFPVAAYVAGPGELAYWAQLKPVFAHFDQPMPIVYPRAQCALTTIKLNKIRTKLGLDLDHLFEQPDALFERVLRNASNNPAYTFVSDERKKIETALQELAEGVRPHDKTAASMAEGLLKETLPKLDRIEKTILQADASKSDAARKQLERLCNSLAPLRKPQERVYTIISFLFEHGHDLIGRLLEETNVESFEMNEIEL